MIYAEDGLDMLASTHWKAESDGIGFRMKTREEIRAELAQDVGQAPDRTRKIVTGICEAESQKERG